ncbi:hypothetical protein TNIN_472011, partial [Trichonephila inaurata madagascariensis]
RQAGAHPVDFGEGIPVVGELARLFIESDFVLKSVEFGFVLWVSGELPEFSGFVSPLLRGVLAPPCTNGSSGGDIGFWGLFCVGENLTSEISDLGLYLLGGAGRMEVEIFISCQ